MFAASLKAPAGLVDFPGIPNYHPTESSESQELARINREIEDVKNEVEKEQRRLSRYQTQQGGRGDAASSTLKRTHSQSTCTQGNREGYKPSSHRRTLKLSSQGRKYVVDNSKPRTDLEYDPLSNFSADLRSYSSSGKDQTDKAGVKRARDGSYVDRHKLPLASRDACPVLEEHLIQEGDLVIDIPSSPDLKKSSVDYVIENQSTVAEQDQSSRHVEAALTPTQSTRGESSSPVTLMESDPSGNGRESRPVDMFDGLSKCLEDLRSENQRIARSAAAYPGMSWDGEFRGPPETSFEDHPRDVRHTVEFNEISTMAAAAQPRRGPHPAPSDPHHHRHHTEEPPAPTHTAHHSWSPAASGPPVLPCGQTYAAAAAPPPPHPGTSDGDHSRPLDTSSPSPPPPRPAAPPPTRAGPPGGDVIVIGSSSGEEEEEEEEQQEEQQQQQQEEESAGQPPLNYSDLELSDSDPMEECYRIFMEANEAAEAEEPWAPGAGNAGLPGHPQGLPKGHGGPAPPPSAQALTPPPQGVRRWAEQAETPAPVDEAPQALSAQKRVAHVPRCPEPAAAIRPQPQVLVPLRGGPCGAQLPHPHKVLQAQLRTTTLATSVRAGHAFASSSQQRRPEAGAVVPPSQNHVQHPIAVQSAYMSCIPVGSTVFQVGNSLHFILPEGSYPLPVASGAVSAVLTPHAALAGGGPLPSFQPPAVSLVHRYRPDPSAPVHVAGVASSSLPAASAPAPLSAPQGAPHVPPKLLGRRRARQRPDRQKDKVPHDVRQRYVNMFTEEFLKTSPSVKDSFEKALAEERVVYNRSANKLKYLSVAVNALKRLKNLSAAPTKDDNEASGTTVKGNIPLDVSRLLGRGDAALYDSLKEYVMNEEKLIEHNYPLQNPERPGSAILFADTKKGSSDPLKRICCRCGATYSVSKTGKHTRKEECNYHYGKGVERKVPGGVETRYSCCEGVMGAPGCQVFKLHVHDAVNMDGFVSSQPREDSDEGCPGVFSLDCEMCYTTQGLELSRVTVVNSALQVVYDTFVKPDNDVIDFNTRFSGISEEDMSDGCPSVRDVHATLLRFVSADSILVGHGLETSLCALKFLHGTVVDTSVVFPHRMGPPHKLTLNSLTADHLRRIIQDSVCGHDTADAAAACMELLQWKVKEDGRGRKW